MKKILLGISIVILVVSVGLVIRTPVQHEINMRQDPIYAEAYETLVVPHGYSMDDAYGFVSNPGWDNVLVLVSEFGYTFREAFEVLPFYQVAGYLESQLEYVDVLLVETDFDDRKGGLPYLLIIVSINPDLLPEGNGAQLLIDATHMAITRYIPMEYIVNIYYILGFDQGDKGKVVTATECAITNTDINLCTSGPIAGDLYPESMPWVGPTPLLDN